MPVFLAISGAQTRTLVAFVVTGDKARCAQVPQDHGLLFPEHLLGTFCYLNLGL